MEYDVLILGAGASGLMCAIEVAKRGRKVAVLEHAHRVGQKILISGGGHCNFTNLSVSPENYVSRNKDFCRSALARYTPSDFLALLAKHEILYLEKEQGELFCRGPSRDILAMLLAEAKWAHVNIFTNCQVGSITKNESFHIATNKGEFECSSLVVATGGLSYPKLGATGIGHRIAQDFGHRIIDCRPGLVPFIFNERERRMFSELSGVSIEATVSCNGRKFTGGVLFTKNGLSGPPILQLSLYWRKGDKITIELLPGTDILNELKKMKQDGSKALVKNILSGFISKRLALAMCAYAGILQKPIANFSDKELLAVSVALHDWQIIPRDTEGLDVAEVTVGGVDVNEVSSKTFESKKVDGLYFIGEVLDVTGQLGGYNLHWAWASGHVAGVVA